MDAASVWLVWLLTYDPESIAMIVAVFSLIVSVSAFTRTARDSAARREAHSRAAVSVAQAVLPPLVDFIRNPTPTEARVVLETRGLWRDLDRFATMAERKTRKVGQQAVGALNAWEEAWREYNYNPHTEERHASAQRAAGAARELVAALTHR